MHGSLWTGVGRRFMGLCVLLLATLAGLSSAGPQIQFNRRPYECTTTSRHTIEFWVIGRETAFGQAAVLRKCGGWSWDDVANDISVYATENTSVAPNRIDALQLGKDCDSPQATAKVQVDIPDLGDASATFRFDVVADDPYEGNDSPSSATEGNELSKALFHINETGEGYEFSAELFDDDWYRIAAAPYTRVDVEWLDGKGDRIPGRMRDDGLSALRSKITWMNDSDTTERNYLKIDYDPAWTGGHTYTVRVTKTPIPDTSPPTLRAGENKWAVAPYPDHALVGAQLIGMEAGEYEDRNGVKYSFSCTGGYAKRLPPYNSSSRSAVFNTSLTYNTRYICSYTVKDGQGNGVSSSETSVYTHIQTPEIGATANEDGSVTVRLTNVLTNVSEGHSCWGIYHRPADGVWSTTVYVDGRSATFSSLSPNSEYQFEADSFNAHGVSSAGTSNRETIVTYCAKPSTPAVQAGATWISCRIPAGDASAASHYGCQYRRAAVGDWQTEEDDADKGDIIGIQGLDPGTDYQVRIVAYDQEDRPRDSDSVHIQTKPCVMYSLEYRLSDTSQAGHIITMSYAGGEYTLPGYMAFVENEDIDSDAFSWPEPVTGNAKYRFSHFAPALPTSATRTGANTTYIAVFEPHAARHTLTAEPAGLDTGLPPDVWISQDASQSVTAPDAVNGYSFVRWRKDNGDQTEGQRTIVMTEPRSISWTAVYEDRKPPGAPTLICPSADGAWHATDSVTVTWQAAETTGTAIAGGFYRVNGGAVHSFSAADDASSGAFSASLGGDEGTLQIGVWLRDQANNASDSHSSTVSVKIDGSVPTANVTIFNAVQDGLPLIRDGFASLRLTAADLLSGVAEMRFGVSGVWTSWKSFSSSETVDLFAFATNVLAEKPNTNTLRAQIRDNVGNTRTVAASFYYDPFELDDPSFAVRAEVVPCSSSSVRILWNRGPRQGSSYLANSATVKYNAGTGWEGISTSNTGSYTLTGIGALQLVNARVRLVDTDTDPATESAFSAVASGRSYAESPGVPLGLALEPNLSTIAMNWRKGDGGTPARYQYRWRADAGNWSPTKATTTTATVLDGLAEGVTYTVEVRAVCDDAAPASQKSSWAQASITTLKRGRLHVTPTSVSCSAIRGRYPSSSPTVTIRNDGTAPLDWRADFTSGSGSNRSGTLAGDATNTISLTPDTRGRGEGTHTYAVRFRNLADSGNDVTVTLTAKVTNRAPSVRNVRISPATPRSGDGLRGHYHYVDPDGHSQSGTRIRWYRNGRYVRSGGSVSDVHVVKGQRWVVKVKPRDSYKYGREVTSATITVRNRPPSISGRTLPRLRQGEEQQTNLLKSADDRDDGDSELSFTIVSDSSDGAINASIVGQALHVSPSAEYFGVAQIGVRVSDGDGGNNEGEFTVEVDAQPQRVQPPPQNYDINEDESLEIDLWDFFEDPEPFSSRLTFTVADDREFIATRVRDGRFLAVSGDADWPYTDDGPQAATVTVTATDRMDQTADWGTPSFTVHPVNDPPRWTGAIRDLTMSDGDADPRAVTSVDTTSLRDVLADIDTDLSRVAAPQLIVPVSADEGLHAVLDGDGIRITPDGGWWDTTTVTLTVHDREDRAEPHDLTAATSFQVTVRDDDTAAPVFSAFDVRMVDIPAGDDDDRKVDESGDAPVLRVVENEPFHLRCDIWDGDNTVYDEKEGGPDHHGVYLLWDNDGDLSDGGETFLTMSLVPDHDSLYETDAPIPGQDGAVTNTFVYEIFAWDDDHDRGFAGDRKMGRTGLRRDIVINDRPEITLGAMPEQYRDDVSMPLQSIADVNQDPLRFQVQYRDPGDGQWKTGDVIGFDGQELSPPVHSYTDRTVIWRSRGAEPDSGDLPGVDNGTQQVRVRASDGFHFGPWFNRDGEDHSFHLDNNRLPRISLASAAENGEFRVESADSLPAFAYQLQDEEADTSRIRFEYRWGSDAPWTPATMRRTPGLSQSPLDDALLTGLRPGDGENSAYAGVVYWDAVANAENDQRVPLTPGDFEDVQFRTTPTDENDIVAGHAVEWNTPKALLFTLDLFPAPSVVLPNTQPDRSMLAAELVHPGPDPQNAYVDLSYAVDPGYLRFAQGEDVWYQLGSRVVRAGATVADLPAGLLPDGPVVTFDYAFVLAGEPAPGPRDDPSHPIAHGGPLFAGIYPPDITGSRGFRTYSSDGEWQGYANHAEIAERWLFQVGPEQAPLHLGALPSATVKGVRLGLRPTNDEPGRFALSEPLTLDNNRAPEVTGLALSETGNVVVDGQGTERLRGNVSLDFLLSDMEGNAVDFTFEYTEGAGGNPRPATVLHAATWRGVPPGNAVVVWDSRVDLGARRIDAVRFRVTPADTSEGVSAVSAPFALDNRNLTPGLTLTDPEAGAVSGSIPVRFDTTDGNGDGLATTNWQFSLDQGATWTAIPEEDIGLRYPQRPGIDRRVIWNSHLDLPPHYRGTVLFRMAVTDASPLASAVYPAAHPADGDVDGVLWDGEHECLWTFDLSPSVPLGDRAYLRDPGADYAPDDSAHLLHDGLNVPAGADAASGLAAADAPDADKTGPLFSLPGRFQTFMFSAWDGSAFTRVGAPTLESRVYPEGGGFIDPAGICRGEEADSLWFSVPNEGRCYRFAFGDPQYTPDYEVKDVESFRLATQTEADLACCRVDDGTAQSLVGIWSLDAPGVLRQYARADGDGDYTLARVWDTGREGLNGFSFQGVSVWLTDGDADELLRCDTVPVSRFADPIRIEVDNTGFDSVPDVQPPALTPPADTTDNISLTDLNVPADALETSVRWFRQAPGETVPERVAELDGATLVPANATHALDRWQALVRVRTARGWSADVWTDPVTVPNSPPTAGSLRSRPEQAYTSNPLIVTGRPADKDRHLPDNALHTTWEKTDVDGVTLPMTEFDDAWAVDGRYTTVGEVWRCTVAATDELDSTTKFVFEWTVDNRLPWFTRVGPHPVDEDAVAFSVSEGEWVTFRLEAEDPDKPYGMPIEDVVQFFIRDPEADAGTPDGWDQRQFGWFDDGRPRVPFTFDPPSHTFFWWPNYTMAGNPEAADGYDFVLRLRDLGPDRAYDTPDDGRELVSQTVTVHVQNADRAPYLYPLPDMAAREGQTIDIPFAAIDLDQPDGADFTVEVSGWRADEWTVQDAHLRLPTDFDDAGTHDIAVTVSDGAGGHSPTRSARIHLADTNRAPMLDPVPDQTVAEGDPLAVSLQARDPDGDGLALQTDSLPPGAEFLDNGDGTASLTWTPNFDHAGEWFASIHVLDNGAPQQGAGAAVRITVTNTPADTDDDGLDDDWERRWFSGLDRDETGDLDGDGFSDRQEHDAGSNPTWPADIPERITRNYHLTPGWNTVVIDVEADDMTLAALFAGIVDHLDQVRGWNADRQHWWRWQVTPLEGESPPDDIVSVFSDQSPDYTVAVRHPLEVNVTDACNLTMQGVTTLAPVDLMPGWNMAGIPAYTPMELRELFAPLLGVAVLIQDAVISTNEYDPFNDVVYGAWRELSPRHAVWINLTAPGRWP